MASEPARQVLEGVRVVDLSRWVSGEFATKILGDFGADVVKVEKPGVGSYTRHWGPFRGDAPDLEASALFLHLNTNKRSMVADLTAPHDRDVVRRLIASADAVVESFGPGNLERLGLGPDVLRALKPDLVLTRISPFGQTGPYRNWAATGIVLQATGGPMNATGGADRPPLRKPGLLEHYTIGRSAAQATLAGLYHSRRTGSGSVIDVSGQEVLLAGADRRASYLLASSYSGSNAPRGVRSAHRGTTTLTGPFRARDGLVMLYVTSLEHWNRLVRLIAGDDRAFQDKFVDRRHVGEDWEEFAARLDDWFAALPKNDIMERAQSARVPCTAFLRMDELFAHPHFRAREAFVSAHHPVAGELEYVGAPWRMRGGFALRRAAPLLGEHTDQLLDELEQMPPPIVEEHLGEPAPRRYG